MTTTAYQYPVDVDAFWRKGYQIVRGVYTKDEIQDLRDRVYASRSHGGDLLSNPRLRDVLLDGRLLSIARTLLGNDEILYTGDSSFTINSNQHGYHKDNTDRTDPNAPDWQGRYSILRFGIYLQDHKWHTLGLNLREGSHNTPDLKVGKNIYVRTGVGDVAVWSLRTSHSGNGTLLKLPWMQPDPSQKKTYPSWMVAKKDGDRLAVFAALGLDDAHHDRYANYLKSRTYMCNIWRRSHYDEETLAMAKAAGLKVRDMPREIEGDPTAGQNELWQPTPY